jgi:hypothetical protein
MMSVCAFVEGVLFLMFTWELLQEQVEAMEDNQTYVDDKQKLQGKPQDLEKTAIAMFGKDKWWWAIPTHPCLHINYLERLYSKNQIRQQKRQDEPFEEDEFDLNKKHYLKELRKSNFEKRIVQGILLVSMLAFYIFVNETLNYTQLTIDPSEEVVSE